jgi:hypothetical protein
MAHIVMIVAAIGPAETGSDVLYQLIARTSDMQPTTETISFYVQLDPAMSASSVNSSLIDAGVAAALAAGHTVGETDQRTLLGGAVESEPSSLRSRRSEIVGA